MSFLFNWMDLGRLDLKASFNDMLSSASIPQLPQKVSISFLSLGTKSPKFEILEIVDLNETKFKGLFKFSYDGELNVTFKTDYEANAIKLIDFDMFTKPSFVLSDKSTILPVELKIKNVKIDAILTVVYNGRITVVFNDDPFIDLDIETSLDEFLDEELFQMIKQDTMNLISEALKQDLPELLHSFSLEDNDKLSNMESLLEKEVAEKLEGPTTNINADTPSTLFDHPTAFKPQEHVFDTLSLKPQGFTDVVQRFSLSKHEYQNLESQVSKQDGQKKRRVIKMNKKPKRSTPKHKLEENKDILPDITFSTVDEASFSQAVADEEQVSFERTSHSESSATTLIDQSFTSISTNSLDDYLNQETLVSETPQLNKLDPYESLTHPMDLLPCYKNDLENSKILTNAFRPRGPSSNYINLNNDFKEFILNNDGESPEDEIFYDI